MLLAENLYSQSCQWSRKEEEEKWSKKEEDEEKSEAANRAQFFLKQLLPGPSTFTSDQNCPNNQQS